MKRSLVSLLLVVIFIGYPKLGHTEFTRNKIAVLDFMLQGQGFETEDLGQIVAEWLVTALVKEGRFDVVERRLLKKIIAEQQLSESGVLDRETTAQLGKVLGVKVVVSGSVMQIQDVIEVNSRIIDVESGSILAAESVRSKDANQLQSLVEQMAKKIIKAFPLEGYIVNRIEENVTIDLGRFSGVKPGMVFMVYTEGEVVKHPKTGEVLDVVKTQTGTISIHKVSEKLSECFITSENTPNAIEYGQLVKSTAVNMRDKRSSVDDKMAGVLLESKNMNGALFVDAVPHGSKIRILNITPRYYRGIVLNPGNYHVEVTAPDHEMKKLWVSILPGEKKYVSVLLEKAMAKISTQDKTDREKRAQSSIKTHQKEYFKYLSMLRSDNSKTKLKSAKIVYKRKLFQSEILQVVNDELLKGFQTNTRDRYHVDCMAWFCRILGASRQVQYKYTLETVASRSKIKKIKGHAIESARRFK